MKLYYKRKFDAAHQLGNPQFAKEFNEKTYGKCLFLHGHSWIVEFELGGQKSDETGMIVNFNILKDLIDRLDHSKLNDTIMLPTAENLADYFLNHLRDMQLFTSIKVTIWESDNASITSEWEID